MSDLHKYRPALIMSVSRTSTCPQRLYYEGLCGCGEGPVATVLDEYAQDRRLDPTHAKKKKKKVNIDILLIRVRRVRDSVKGQLTAFFSSFSELNVLEFDLFVYCSLTVLFSNCVLR